MKIWVLKDYKGNVQLFTDIRDVVDYFHRESGVCRMISV